MAIIEAPRKNPSRGGSLEGQSVRRGDRAFLGLTRNAGILVLVILAASPSSWWSSRLPAPERQLRQLLHISSGGSPTTPRPSASRRTFGTLMTAAIAMIIAVPLGIGTAMFIAFYRRLASSLAFVVDVLAAVPSIIFGLWGLEFLMPNMFGLTQWMNDYLGFIPCSTTPPASTSRSSSPR